MNRFGSKGLKPRVPVLLYHRIDIDDDPRRRPFCVHPEQFARQMHWLAEQGYRTIDLEQLKAYYTSDHPIPERAIVLTFDDGYYCNYSRAFPILNELGFTATIFVITDFVRKAQPTREGPASYLSWDEIRALREAGIKFGAHTCTHRPLTSLALDEAREEICRSREILASKLAEPIPYFCYPFGAYNDDIKRLVKECGFEGACGGGPFWDGGPKDWYSIGRTEIYFGDSLVSFKFKVKFGLGYYYFTKRQLGLIKRKLLSSAA